MTVLANKGDLFLDPVVHNVNRHPVLKFAASELFKYLKRINDVCKNSKQLIRLSFSYSNEDKFANDEFTISVGKKSIAIEGTTPRSVLFGVYALLERLGCVWPYPGEAEEYIPKLSRIELPLGSFSEKAHITVRGLGLYGLQSNTVQTGAEIIDWMGKNRFNLVFTSEDRRDSVWTQSMHWPEVRSQLLPEIVKRGMLLEISEHMTHLFMSPSDLAEHPEWTAIVDGKRSDSGGQMCYSNPDAVKLFKKKFIQFIKKRPEADIIGIWPLDGGGYCKCNACLNDNAVFNATAEMAKAAALIRPKLQIEYLAYTAETKKMPCRTDEFPPNMTALVCDEIDDNAKPWIDLSGNGKGSYLFEYNMGDNYRWQGNIWIRPDFVKWMTGQIIRLKYHGVISLFIPISNWWRACMNYWFFSKFSWQPEANTASLLKKHCISQYNGAGSEIACVLQQVFKEIQTDDMLAAYHHDRLRSVMPLKPPRADCYIEFQSALSRALKTIVKLEEDTENTEIRTRLMRWVTYLKFLKHYYRIRTGNGKPIAFKDHSDIMIRKQKRIFSVKPEDVPVNPSFEFLEWRFDKIARWDGGKLF